MLALSDHRHVFAWGANDQGQLGIGRKLSEKVIEFSSYAYEDSHEAEKGAPHHGDSGAHLDDLAYGPGGDRRASDESDDGERGSPRQNFFPDHTDIPSPSSA